jgi:hypothetical protein
MGSSLLPIMRSILSVVVGGSIPEWLAVNSLVVVELLVSSEARLRGPIGFA